MINDKSLEDRLNAVRNGNPLPAPPNKNPNILSNQVTNIPTTKNSNINIILRTLDSFLASFLYGYAISTIFSLEWSLLGSLAVGFLINHSISVFPKKIFPKRFK